MPARSQVSHHERGEASVFAVDGDTQSGDCRHTHVDARARVTREIDVKQRILTGLDRDRVIRRPIVARSLNSHEV
jgi:hypothetical protein